MPFNNKMRKHFERVVQVEKPDIIHSHSMNDVTTACWVAAKRSMTTLIHTLRNYDLICSNGTMYHSGGACGPKCRLISYAKRKHHLAIDGVVAVSNETLTIHHRHNLFQHIPPEKQKIIWNSARVPGLDRHYRKPSREKIPFTFGFLGRVTEEKGVGLLIEAARKLENDGTWQVIIAGDGPHRQRFLEAALGLPIYFLGTVEPLTLFEQIDVLVVPSLWSEPFGRIVVEAYHADTPVLTSDMGGLPELIAGSHEVWVTASGSIPSLSKRMAELLQCGRVQLPKKSDFAEVLRKTDPDHIAKEYIEFYDTVRRSNGRPK